MGFFVVTLVLVVVIVVVRFVIIVVVVFVDVVDAVVADVYILCCNRGSRGRCCGCEVYYCGCRVC